MFATSQRDRQPETMDDPGLDTPALHGALAGLTRLNWLSGSIRLVWQPLAQLARELGVSRLRVLDVATGAGDIPLGLWQRGRNAGLSLEIEAIDISERSLELARAKAEQRRAPIRFSQSDVISAELPRGFDAVISSLFLHHLDWPAAEMLLAKMADAANHLVVVNDLRRCRTGLALAYVAGHLLSRSPVVRADAVRSVRAALTLAEVHNLAVAAGLSGCKLQRRWPCRYVLTWRRLASVK